ncbi:MAG TPA: preprotein translocase subunit SecG [Candidatus Eisenbacteria bacterium]|nr:preprotein translocase subunit SecG [Candidatus Eisenbacteria bacterium]
MIFLIIQILIAVLLIICVALQMQGSGLSTAFGGSGEFFRSKRSIERFLYIATIVLAALFAGISLFLLYHR